MTVKDIGEVGTKAINLAIQEKYSLGQELEYKTNFDGKFRIDDNVFDNIVKNYGRIDK